MACVKSRAEVARHRARRREGNPDCRVLVRAACPPGPAGRGEPERAGNTALTIGVAGLPPCGLGRPLRRGRPASEAPQRETTAGSTARQRWSRSPSRLPAAMSPLAGAARREPQAARSAAERGHRPTINASITLEQAPIRTTGESVPSRHHGPQDALTPVPPIAGSTTARPGALQPGCRGVLDSDPVLPGGSRAEPPCPPSPIVLRHGSLPVGAETWFRGSGRRSRVEPGRHLPGRPALLSLGG